MSNQSGGKIDFDKLDDDEVGFSINKKWEIKFAMPKHDDDDYVEDHVLYVSALAVLTRCEDFRDYVMDRFFKEVGEMEEDDEGDAKND